MQTATATGTTAAAAPVQPAITIISSDGEAFSVPVSTVAHSQLLGGAVRKWAEVYQVKPSPPSSTEARLQHQNRTSLPRHGADGHDDDDATTTDITVEDPEVTPDEHDIEGYYDETASDLSATSGGGDDAEHQPDGTGIVEGGANRNGEAAATAAASNGVEGDSEGSPQGVMRMVSVPVNDDDDGEDREANETSPEVSQAPPLTSLNRHHRRIDGRDSSSDSDDSSDRTASVFTSSIEGSTPNSVTSSTSVSNGNTPTRPANVLSASALHDVSPLSQESLSAIALSPPKPGGTYATSSGNGGAAGAPERQAGNPLSVPSSPLTPGAAAAAAAAAAAVAAGGSMDWTRGSSGAASGPSGRTPHTPGAAGTGVLSPVSRGSHTSPLTLMDADQSTPSVLSEEEEEGEEREELEGSRRGPATAAATRTDPRNLGDEGLEGEEGGDPRGAAAVTSEALTPRDGDSVVFKSADRTSSSDSPSPSPEAITGATALVNGTTHGNNGGANSQLKIIAVPTTRHGDPTVGSVARKLPPAGPRRAERRRQAAMVVQAGVVEAEDEDETMLKGEESIRSGQFQLSPRLEDASHAAAGTVTSGGGLTAPASGSARTPSPNSANQTLHNTPDGNVCPSISPLTSWLSPSSCHQRTPCMADEDDVGAMVGDDDGSFDPDILAREGGAGSSVKTPPASTTPNSAGGARLTPTAGGSVSPNGRPSPRGGAAVLTTSNPSPTFNDAAGGHGATSPRHIASSLPPPEDTAKAAAGAGSSSSFTATSAEPAAAPESTYVYDEGIRITSSAIVFDLVHFHTPQSLREFGGGGDLNTQEECTLTDAELLSLSSAAGTVASAEDRGAAAATGVFSGAAVSAEAGYASSSERKGSSAAVASPTAGPSVNIHSTTLLLCIKYMTHFAEVEAAAAAEAEAAGKKKKQAERKKKRKQRRHRRQHGSDTESEEEAEADEDSDDTAASHDSSGESDASPSSSSDASSSLSSSHSDSDNDESSDTEDVSDGSDGDTSTVSNNSISPPIVVHMEDGKDGAGKPGSLLGVGVDGAKKPLGGPAAIPMPLQAPLVRCLSAWERTFLYTDILGCPASVLTAALAILDVCPDFDYFYFGEYLSDATIKAALMTPPPSPEGVRTLMNVMAAAKQLQIDPLHALCAGWLADFMVRVSYGAADNFEAAHLIRQCLRVPSDWTRRETDCLKIENEWPANEDAE